jgi:hypothetical protein
MEIKSNHLYIFFENHKRVGYFNNFFGKRVIKYAQEIQKRNNTNYPLVNHIGCLFRYQNEIFIAELDYFCGGKIIKKLDKNLEEFQIFEIGKMSDQQRTNIVQICNDAFVKKSWYYSFRRYSFFECLGYTDNKILKLELIAAGCCKFLNNLFAKVFTKNNITNDGYNCIKLTFEILANCNHSPLQNKSCPHQLLFDLMDNQNVQLIKNEEG